MGFKFNPLTGQLDLVGTSTGSASPDNFSYSYIAGSTTVTIPENQQMLYVGPITIDGTLVINGTAIEVIS